MMENGKELLEQMFGDSLDELKGTYMTGMANAMALVNTSIVMCLLHKSVLKENREDTVSFITKLLDETHDSIASSVLESLSGTDELEFIKEEMGGIITEVRTILDETCADIKKGIIEGFGGTLTLLEKLNGEKETKQ